MCTPVVIVFIRALTISNLMYAKRNSHQCGDSVVVVRLLKHALIMCLTHHHGAGKYMLYCMIERDGNMCANCSHICTRTTNSNFTTVFGYDICLEKLGYIWHFIEDPNDDWCGNFVQKG